MKDRIIDWIENQLSDRVDYYDDFMSSLEKSYPKLHEKIQKVIWDFAATEVENEMHDLVKIQAENEKKVPDSSESEDALRTTDKLGEGRGKLGDLNSRLPSEKPSGKKRKLGPMHKTILFIIIVVVLGLIISNWMISVVI